MGRDFCVKLFLNQLLLILFIWLLNDLADYLAHFEIVICDRNLKHVKPNFQPIYLLPVWLLLQHLESLCQLSDMNDMERNLVKLISFRTCSASNGASSLVIDGHESIILKCSCFNRIHCSIGRLDPTFPSDHLISSFRHFWERLLSLH